MKILKELFEEYKNFVKDYRWQMLEIMLLYQYKPIICGLTLVLWLFMRAVTLPANIILMPMFYLIIFKGREKR